MEAAGGAAGGLEAEEEEYRPLQESMCEDCVEYMLRVHLPQTNPVNGSDETVRDELSKQPCVERVHALIMIVLQLRNAGVDVSEIPEDPVQMETWLTFHLNNGLNPVVVYHIQQDVNSKFPDCELNVPNLISRWLSADLESTLTLKHNGHIETSEESEDDK